MIHNKSFQHLEVSTLQKNKSGKNCCGDSFFIKETEDYIICAVADGLGSGEEAKESSAAAISVVRSNHHEDLSYIIETSNKVLKNKRGVVLTIFKINFDKKTIDYCCIGNIRFILSSPSGEVINPLPDRGFLSGRPQKYRIQHFNYEAGSFFVVYSDGLSGQSIKKVVLHKSPQDIATMINQKMNKQLKIKDDVTLLVGEFK